MSVALIYAENLVYRLVPVVDIIKLFLEEI